MTSAQLEEYRKRTMFGSLIHPDQDESMPIKANFTLSKSTDESKLNKTEARYLAYLRLLKYPWIGIQNMTLKLADDTRLTPDFVILDVDGSLVAIDVKGFQREDALIKMKVAARQFTWMKFKIVSLEKGEWIVREVKP
jgi:hypothetical protein